MREVNRVCAVACGIAAILLVLLMSFSAQAQDNFCDPALADIPPKDRQPSLSVYPQYPQECAYSADLQEGVVLRFDVRSNGKPKSISIVETTNACFNKAAKKAVKTWRYRCVPHGLNGVETIISFEFVGRNTSFSPASYAKKECLASTEDSAVVQPLIRVPPQYPSLCHRNSKASELVVMSFDVTPTGDTENLRVTESSNDCFNDAAISSVAKWRYICSKNGVRGVFAQLEFKLEGEEPTHFSQTKCYLFNMNDVSASEVSRDTQLADRCGFSTPYPPQCIWKGRKSEEVFMGFDVASDGTPENISLQRSTSECFNAYATYAVERARYKPTANGYKDLGVLIYYQMKKKQ